MRNIITASVLGLCLSIAEPVGAVELSVLKDMEHWIEANTDYELPETVEISYVDQPTLQIKYYGDYSSKRSLGGLTFYRANGDTVIWIDREDKGRKDILLHELVHAAQGPANDELELACDEQEAYALDEQWSIEHNYPMSARDPWTVVENEGACNAGFVHGR